MSLHTSLDRSLLVPHRIHSNRLTASLLLTQPFQPASFFIPPDLSIVAKPFTLLPLGSGKLYIRIVPCDSTNTRVRGPWSIGLTTSLMWTSLRRNAGHTVPTSRRTSYHSHGHGLWRCPSHLLLIITNEMPVYSSKYIQLASASIWSSPLSYFIKLMG